ncbi:flagellar export protein FliJ [Nitrosovibrio tenuis]|uniref:Flagellar FliJ protein n=1 Tax=Nitrosovibrio tenuis TaxID=1233 RepID=A0A1H7J3D8_9PROT|nr:flagellar export protein FliJ [Nitrosovibrio tenuis]SEK69188.1 flagellar FliJ protein [Nitrosovibrio tenuis]
MSERSALETLIELAQTRADDAAKRLGALNAQNLDMEAKLVLLLQYCDEYRARFQASMQRGLTASDWRNYHEFLNKLDAAIVQQREILILMRQRVAAGQTAWQTARQTLSSYDTLDQRRVRAETLRAARYEQKQSDEHVTNSATRRDGSHSSHSSS